MMDTAPRDPGERGASELPSPPPDCLEGGRGRDELGSQTSRLFVTGPRSMAAVTSTRLRPRARRAPNESRKRRVGGQIDQGGQQIPYPLVIGAPIVARHYPSTFALFASSAATASAAAAPVTPLAGYP